MPRHRPATSGYARLAQADEDEGRLSLEQSDDEYDATAPLSTRYEAIIPPGPRDGMRSVATRGRPSKPRKRMRSNSSGIDIKAINARLEKWADEIASKFKLSSVKGKSDQEEQLEIHHSVFQAPDGVRPYTTKQLAELPPADEGPDRCNKQHFDEIVESVRVAIELGTHPKMISQGSSGSYFARNADGKVVGVFKPKDEEPYASRNPKWTKWIHRNLFPCFFGRACLIPNLSYVSEAAAYVLDLQLRTNIVPHTDIVWLASKSFYYDFWEKGGFWRRNKTLPAKPGSFQVFLKGYKDATVFLREHPWPDQNNVDFRADIVDKKKRRPLANCMPGGSMSDEEDEASRIPSPDPQENVPKFLWTPTLKQAFREELEKLVILDYIMRNTDRGLDNWMIKIDWQTQDVSIVAEPPKAQPKDENGEMPMPAPRPISVSPRPESNTSRPYRRYEAMDSRSSTPLNAKDIPAQPTIRLGAIDNSLSWPWKHPDAWRSFPFGWLFLPVSLIGQPFSKKTRDHFLPLLTSTAWWSETQLALRKVFIQDDDFKESMFARQIAVMKGQAWNVVETLKQLDHGPLELTRRTRVCVWDDLVDVPVAIPMRPSTELSRSRKQVRVHPTRHAYNDSVSADDEEMDIGMNHSTSAPAKTHPPQHAAGPSLDLLGSPTIELPNPNRFGLTRENSHADIGRGSTEDFAGLPSPVFSNHTLDAPSRDRDRDRDHAEASQNLSNSMTLPPRPSTKSEKKPRFSMDFPRHKSSQQIPTGSSSSAAAARRHRSNSTRTAGGKQKGFEEYEYEDDAAGDLGYAAATDMEGQKRKVIVERLEAVESRRPVFTWC